MSSESLIFMGSDSIALPVLDSIREGRCGRVSIDAIYTQPDRPKGRGKKIAANEIKLWAREHGVPVFQPRKMGKDERLEIQAIGPKAILVMAYGHILSQKLIDVPEKGIWNLHTSLLPKYRGASPIQSAIVSGESKTGVSLMKVVRRMDAGPILDIEKVRIEEQDTSVELEKKLSSICPILVERNLERIMSGDVSTEEQKEDDATYTRKLLKNDGELDFRRPAVELARRINGLFPWPAAKFEYRGVSIKIGLASSHDEGTDEGSPGEIVGLSEQGLELRCGQGTLCLKRLQRPGGKMIATSEFVRGFQLPIGEKLESKPMSLLVASEPHIF
tara:strand:+ start:318 stop:1310 length:993 start_codon:yes stop_codon:yes gene_type:complete